MFKRLLINDLKGNKVINTIAFLFITIAAIMLACSVNLLSISLNGIDKLIEQSKVSDFTYVINQHSETDKKVNEFNSNNNMIDKVTITKTANIDVDNISIGEGKGKLSPTTQYLISTVNQERNITLSEKNKPIEIEEGYAYLPFYIKNQTQLAVGDTIKIKLDGTSYKYTVGGFYKDAAFGTGMMPIKRVLISGADFDKYYKNVKAEDKINLYTYDLKSDYKKEKFEGKFTKDSNITPMAMFSKDTFKTALFMENGMIAAILLLVSFISIGILILTLSFLIKSLIYDEFKQIGIMKALGIPSFKIKTLYLTKYIFLTILGTVIGTLISIPIVQKVLNIFSSSMIVSNNETAFLLSVLCNLALISLITLCVYGSMKKVNKLEPLSFIRSSNSSAKNGFNVSMKLYKNKILPISTFLALEEICLNIKNYVLLIVVFVLSSIMVIIPLNLGNTFNDKAFGENYAGITNGEFYVVDRKIMDDQGQYTTKAMEKDLETVTKELKNVNENIVLKPELTGSTRYISDNKEIEKNITFINSAKEAKVYKYLQGKAPIENNEVAITTVLAKEFNKGVGDEITLETGKDKGKYKITGIFQSVYNIGQLIRFSDKNKPENVTGVVYIGFSKDGTALTTTQIEKIIKYDKKIKVISNEEYIGSSLGAIKKVITALTFVISIISMTIILLMTNLFTIMFISREDGQIAIFKSIGIKNSIIKKWQGLRILFLLVPSIIVGILIANYYGAKLVGLALGNMGMQEVSFTINTMQVYVIYPLILFAIVFLGIQLGLRKIKRIDIRQMFES